MEELSMGGQAGGARGRPRHAAVDDAIERATLELLEENGYAALTIAAVAARSGVSKPTIYLRWPSKVPLVADAMARYMDFGPLPDTGSLRGDLLAVLRIIIGSLSRTGAGRILEGLVADLHRHPDLASSFRERYFEPRWQGMKQVLARAQARGEVPRDVNFDMVTDALIGPIYYRLLVRGEEPSFELEQQVVDLVVAGLQSPAQRTRAGRKASTNGRKKLTQTHRAVPAKKKRK